MGAQAPSAPSVQSGARGETPKPTQSGAPSHGGASPPSAPSVQSGARGASPKTHPIRSTIPWGRKPQVHSPYHRGQGAQAPKKAGGGCAAPSQYPPSPSGRGQGVGAITRALPPEKEFEKHPPKKISSLNYFFQKPLDKVAKIYYNRIMVSIKSLLTKNNFQS